MKKVSKTYVKKTNPMWSISTLCLPPRLSPLSFLLLHFLADCFLSTWTSDGEPFSALLSRRSGSRFQPAPQRRATASFCSFFFTPSIKPNQMHCHFLRKGPKVPQGTSVLLPHNWSPLSENYSSVPHLNCNGGLQSNQRGCNYTCQMSD